MKAWKPRVFVEWPWCSLLLQACRKWRQKCFCSFIWLVMISTWLPLQAWCDVPVFRSVCDTGCLDVLCEPSSWCWRTDLINRNNRWCTRAGRKTVLFLSAVTNTQMYRAHRATRYSFCSTADAFHSPHVGIIISTQLQPVLFHKAL